MSTDKIGFNNFKAFGEKMQTFSKKPITLVYGPNSIGKSSLIHMMAYRNQLLAGSFSPNEIHCGDTISLNGFSSFVHKKDLNNKITLTLDTQYPNVIVETQIGQIDIDNYKIIKDLLTKYIINNEVIIEAKYIKDEGYKVTLNLLHPHMVGVLDKIKNNGGWNAEEFKRALGKSDKLTNLLSKENNFSFLKYLIDEEYNTGDFNITSGVDIQIEESRERPFKWTRNDELARITVAQMKQVNKDPFSGIDAELPSKQTTELSHSLISMDNINFEDDTTLSLNILLKQYAIDIAREINQSANSKSNENNFEYIGPLRFYPERNDAYLEIRDNETVDSEKFWSLLQKDPILIDKLNIWLSNDKLNTPYEIKLRKTYDLSNLFKLNLEKYSKDDIEKYSSYSEELVFEDKRTNTLVHNREMGLGVTQILPIIGTTILNKKYTIAIEQPELHLHPKIQSEVADEFIRSYKENENNFLIETHSEHLLLRIMKRMRYTAEDRQDRDKTLDLVPDDICLLYVDNNGKTTYINELELDNDGSLLDPWPNGFFEEGHKERFE